MSNVYFRSADAHADQPSLAARAAELGSTISQDVPRLILKRQGTQSKTYLTIRLTWLPSVNERLG